MSTTSPHRHLRLGARPDVDPAARRGLLRAQVTLVAVLAWSLAGLLAPAHAAEGSLCADGGVNVVVDFGDLGGGVLLACDKAGDGKPATEVFEDTGFDLTPVGAFPGAACQVDGKPEDVGCAEMPPAEAYWGLFIAEKGSWGYAPKGADELTLRDGSFVGFSWQSSSEAAPPDIDPTAEAAAASQKPAGESAAESDQPSAEEAGEEDPAAWWVPVAVIVVLLGIAGAALVRRRSVTDRST